MTKKLSLVKYAGEFWVTLQDYTQTRDTTGYSDHASVKSAIRTFVVKQNPDAYISFRGEVQLKNIVQENRNNPLFQAEDFQGTRTALIHIAMLDKLNERFKLAEEYKQEFPLFMEDCEEYMEKELANNEATVNEEVTADATTSRSVMLRHLRQELSRIEKDIEVKQRNREKILQALNAIESLEIEEVI